jgi:hypothetical protein
MVLGESRVRRAIRDFLVRTMPWYDPDGDAVRRRETERVRRRSIAARIALEDIPKRYVRYDDAVRGS